MIKFSRRFHHISAAALASGVATFLLAAAAPGTTAVPSPVTPSAPVVPSPSASAPSGAEFPTKEAAVETSGGTVAAPVAASTPAEPLPNELSVAIDQTQTLSLDRAVATVSVGNPSIIDVNIQNGSRLFLLGKSFGRTNILALDANGKTVLDATVFVTASSGNGALTVYKGAHQLTYNCAPTCQRALMPGDSSEAFQELSGQISSKTSLGASAAGRD